MPTTTTTGGAVAAALAVGLSGGYALAPEPPPVVEVRCPDGWVCHPSRKPIRVVRAAYEARRTVDDWTTLCRQERGGEAGLEREVCLLRSAGGPPCATQEQAAEWEAPDDPRPNQLRPRWDRFQLEHARWDRLPECRDVRAAIDAGALPEPERPRRRRGPRGPGGP